MIYGILPLCETVSHVAALLRSAQFGDAAVFRSAQWYSNTPLCLAVYHLAALFSWGLLHRLAQFHFVLPLGPTQPCTAAVPNQIE